MNSQNNRLLMQILRILKEKKAFLLTQFEHVFRHSDGYFEHYFHRQS